MNDCRTCHSPVPVGVDQCPECVEWEAYWNGMSAAERRSELRSMERHVAEPDGW